MPLLPDLVDGFVDLVLGSACVGCGRPGRALCAGCRDALPDSAALRRPTPCPSGLAPTYSAGEYDGALRALVLAHKERRVLSLARPLGEVLGAAVATALDEAGARPGDPVALVPVPSRPAALRQRGHDPTAAMVRHAVAALTSTGRPAVVAPLLRIRPGVVDQAGLGAEERASNLAGSMATTAPGLRRLAARSPRTHVVICDDVLTTGATLREAQRATESIGMVVLAAATVAATRRRRASRKVGPSLSSSPATD